MKIHFEKYQGAGNDFIIVDNRSGEFKNLTSKQISRLCNRNFGIGADGFISIAGCGTAAFEMRYFNADGNLSTMCGNGGRCAVLFAFEHNISEKATTFLAADGLHTATVVSDDKVCLEMTDVAEVVPVGEDWFVDTGSPHHVVMVETIEKINVKESGALIRYSERYLPKGANVNFVEPLGENHFKIRTYERGVENETLACGTGAVAVAICMYNASIAKEASIQIDTLGDILQVDFDIAKKGYDNIYLTGQCARVFKGSILL